MNNRVAGREVSTRKNTNCPLPNKQMLSSTSMILDQECKVKLGNEKNKIWLILRWWSKASFIWRQILSFTRIRGSWCKGVRTSLGFDLQKWNKRCGNGRNHSRQVCPPRWMSPVSLINILRADSDFYQCELLVCKLNSVFWIERWSKCNATTSEDKGKSIILASFKKGKHAH